MGLYDHWHRMVRRQGGSGTAALQIALEPVGLLYGAVASLLRVPYDLGLRRRTEPALPTISVGNLVLGGAGKTTVTAYLASRLASAGVKPAIVLRGYLGSATSTLRVSDAGALMAGPEQAGDEAVLLAGLCPEATVVVGRRREQAIAAAAACGAQVAILDDGFQYFRMKRDLDVLLVSALQCRLCLRMFPAGILREPLSNLRRADQVWVTYSQAVGLADLEEVKSCCRRLAPQAPIVVTSHRITHCIALEDGTPADLAGLRTAAFCGVGSPEGFQASLRGLAPASLDLRAFPDHHRFTPGDLESVAQWAREAQADVVVTTAKDAVRLRPQDWPPGHPPLLVAQVVLAIAEGSQHVEEVVGRWL